MPVVPGPYSWRRDWGGATASLVGLGGMHTCIQIPKDLDGFHPECVSNVEDTSAFVLRAMNSFSDLLAACKQAEAHFGYLLDNGSLTREEESAVAALRAAIAKAMGK